MRTIFRHFSLPIRHRWADIVFRGLRQVYQLSGKSTEVYATMFWFLIYLLEALIWPIFFSPTLGKACAGLTPARHAQHPPCPPLRRTDLWLTLNRDESRAYDAGRGFYGVDVSRVSGEKSLPWILEWVEPGNATVPCIDGCRNRCHE